MINIIKCIFGLCGLNVCRGFTEFMQPVEQPPEQQQEQPLHPQPELQVSIEVEQEDSERRALKLAGEDQLRDNGKHTIIPIDETVNS